MNRNRFRSDAERPADQLRSRRRSKRLWRKHNRAAIQYQQRMWRTTRKFPTIEQAREAIGAAITPAPTRRRHSKSAKPDGASPESHMLPAGKVHPVTLYRTGLSVLARRGLEAMCKDGSLYEIASIVGAETLRRGGAKIKPE